MPPKKPQEGDDVHLPPIEKRWTYGNVIASVAAVLSLAASVGSWSNAAQSLPGIKQQTDKNTTDISSLRADVDNLKQERRDDIENARVMRLEIIGRLDRIESKLDQKADKDIQARGWTR